MIDKYARIRDSEVFSIKETDWRETRKPNLFSRRWIWSEAIVAPGDPDKICYESFIDLPIGMNDGPNAWSWQGINRVTGSTAEGTCLSKLEAMQDAMNWLKAKQGNKNELALIEQQTDTAYNKFWHNVIMRSDIPPEFRYIDEIGECLFDYEVVTRERAIEIYDWCQQIEGWKDAGLKDGSGFFLPPIIFHLYRDEDILDEQFDLEKVPF